MPQPAVFMLIGLASWVLVSLAIARKWGVPTPQVQAHQEGKPVEILRTWANALCCRARDGTWPPAVQSWPWTRDFDRLLAASRRTPSDARVAMINNAAFTVAPAASASTVPKFYRLGTGFALLGLGLAMIAALGQLAAIITQPGPSAGSSDAGHQALSAVSFSQAGQVGVAALVLLGSAALMNLIARRVRRNAPSMRESLHYKVQQSLAQSMASEAAAWIVSHPPAADTQPLADRLRQFWDVDASSREASSPTAGPIASPHAEQAA